MPDLTPEMAQYLLQQNIQQWSDNLHVQQKALELMVRDAQRAGALDKPWDALIQGGKLGDSMVYARGEIQAMQQYLAQARAALAQGGSAVMNQVRTMGSAGVRIMESAGRFLLENKAQAGGLATAAGQAIGYTVTTGAAVAGAEGAAGAAAVGAVGEVTVAAGTAAVAETTVLAGSAAVVEAAAVVETAAVAGGVAAVETAAVAGGVAAVETAAVAGGAVVAAEAGGAGATLAAGGASGSWLGPVGIVVGVVVTGIVLGGIYVYTQSDSDKQPVAAIATVSSSSDTDSSTSDTDSSSSDSDASAALSTASSSTDSSSDAGDTYVGRFTAFGGTNPDELTSHPVTVNAIRFVVRPKAVEMTMRYTIRIEEGDPSGLEPSCFLLDVAGSTIPVASGTESTLAIDGAPIQVVSGGSPGERSCGPGASFNSEGASPAELRVVRDESSLVLTGSVTTDDGTIMRFEARPGG